MNKFVIILISITSAVAGFILFNIRKNEIPQRDATYPQSWRGCNR